MAAHQRHVSAPVDAVAMPMIDVTLPTDALDEAACAWLVDELLSAVLRWEGSSDDERSRSLAWAFVHRVDAIHMTGTPPSPSDPRYRVGIRTPAGALNDERRAGLVAEATELVLRAEGSLNTPEHAARVWVILDEVTDGAWGAGGRIRRLADMAASGGGDSGPAVSLTTERLVRP